MNAYFEFIMKVVFIVFIYNHLPEIWLYSLPIWIILFYRTLESTPKGRKQSKNPKRARNARKIRVHTGKKANN